MSSTSENNPRREFVKTALAASGALLLPQLGVASVPSSSPSRQSGSAVILSTWDHGMQANARALEVLQAGGSALDAAEKGVMVVESDPKNRSVGIGGRPDREGHVTLDACIMDHQSNCGAVACLEHIENPIAVARRVMEDTPHTMLVGAGALQFAEEKGFKRTNLLTPEAAADWQKWLEESKYQPVINIENHDTIGLVVLDTSGRLAGSCTTSGMAYKLHGRVGDSPIIGAGLFVDGEVGAACATGLGEAVVRTAGSAIIVELMRQGASPQEACEEAIQRILRKHPDRTNLQVGYLAINTQGEVGSCSVSAGFNYALTANGKTALFNAKHLV